MRSNPTKIFYVEVIGLLLLTIVCYLVSSALRTDDDAGPCGSNALQLVPYIYYHYDSICGNFALLATLCLHFTFSIVLISAAQWLLVSGRGRLSVVNRRLFLFVLILFVFLLYGWLTGRPGSISIYDGRIHEGFIFFPLMSAIVIPEFPVHSLSHAPFWK